MKTYSRPIRLLLINQLTINIGFYMLMPYLANHLSGNLGLAVWLVGLILGVRNLTQQGLFLIGGSLADRFGYKPMILSGLLLRTVGFALLGLSESVPVLITASALTGLAGALFNPAARAYLAVEAGERKVEAFALFNVYYQAGILVGPLIGLALQAAAFRLLCLVAAALFGLLAVAQARALPGRGGTSTDSILYGWRQVVRNRPFLLFTLAMAGSYVLNFQVYLGLPIEARRATGGDLGVTLLFMLSGAMSVLGQVRLTAWLKARWSAEQAMVRGLLLMGAAFLPLALKLPGGFLLTTALLTLSTMIVYPFEMATITTLGGERLVGTYYGFYNTVSGIGIAAGNLLVGALLDAGMAWWALAAIGFGCAAAVFLIARTARGGSHKPPLAEPVSRAS